MKDFFVPKTTGMRGRALEEISATFSLLGTCLRKQLSKKILSKGGPWGSIAFLFKDFDKNYLDFGDPKVMLANFKSDGEVYTRQNYFIVKDKEMAQNIIKLLKSWFDI